MHFANIILEGKRWFSFCVLGETYYRSLTTLNLEAFDKLFELGKPFWFDAFGFSKCFYCSCFFQTVLLSFRGNTVVIQYMKMRESVNVIFFHFLIHFVWNRKALLKSSLNWANNCSGQWWMTSLVLNTGYPNLNWNTGTSLKFFIDVPL